ncbi:hypothetical protein GWK47_012347 [Chionoecetes opilio]|uniref:Uncharacterized protein n=1 Tax=Chionoecetes opilio TaxID=41210 RepID=A0A8J5CPH0_CHIOP|nr:hypothetical protein GWK47_012347 [Chionoecetes opilio]
MTPIPPHPPAATPPAMRHARGRHLALRSLILPRLVPPISAHYASRCLPLAAPSRRAALGSPHNHPALRAATATRHACSPPISAHPHTPSYGLCPTPCHPALPTPPLAPPLPPPLVLPLAAVTVTSATRRYA